MINTLIFFLAMLGSAEPPAPSYASEWSVVVSEDGVERRLYQTDPQDIAARVIVDQNLAPGWFCVVKPEVNFEGQRTRFLTCDYKGKTQAAIRTVCSSVGGRRSQEVWLGESYKLSVRLECLSGLTP